MTYGRFLLYPGEILRLDSREALNIRSEQGRLWVTAGREGIDHDILPGQLMRCEHGCILIEGAGIVAISAATPNTHKTRRPALPFVNLALITPVIPDHSNNTRLL